MKIFKKINLNIISIILAILVTFSASLLIFKGIKNYKSGNQPQVNIYACTCDDPDTHYCFDASNSHEYLADWYDYNTEYRIKNYAGLTSFASAVNNGYNFSGKTVNLLADIDCGGNSVGIGTDNYAFAGTFDGNGCTISNITISGNMSHTLTGKQGVKYTYYAYGFFAQLESVAIVKNLFLYDVQCNYPGSGPNDATVIGGIVGYANDNAIVSRCGVENLNARASDTGYRTYTSGIVGAGNVKIDNCYSKNVTSTTSSDLGSYKITGIGPGLLKQQIQQSSYFNSENSVLEKCVAFNNNGTEYTYDISPVSSVNNCYSSVPNDGYINLEDITSIGGETGSAWYYGGINYNDGFPKLRIFVEDWGEVKLTSYLVVKSRNTKIESLTSIYIPEDADRNVNYGLNTTNQTIDIFNQSVTAPEYETYKFTNWERIGKLNYYAYYEWKQYTITFNSTIGETTIAPTGVSSVIVSYGAKINLITTESNKLQYEVVDVNNADGTTIITYDFSGMQYCIIKDNAGVADKFEVTADLTITPTATLKQYGSVWQ